MKAQMLSSDIIINRITDPTEPNITVGRDRNRVLETNDNNNHDDDDDHIDDNNDNDENDDANTHSDSNDNIDNMDDNSDGKDDNDGSGNDDDADDNNDEKKDTDNNIKNNDDNHGRDLAGGRHLGEFFDNLEYHLSFPPIFLECPETARYPQISQMSKVVRTSFSLAPNRPEAERGPQHFCTQVFI